VQKKYFVTFARGGVAPYLLVHVVVGTKLNFLGKIMWILYLNQELIGLIVGATHEP
jgi:hypothetical protein